MTSLRVEFGPTGFQAADASAVPYEWPAEPGHSLTVRSDLGWRGAELGAPDAVSMDLLRVVAAAYTADRVARQPELRLIRTLTLTVHVEEPDNWTTQAKERLVDLLHWLTGDDWALRCVAAPNVGDVVSPVLDVPVVDDVCLLSGGLDSFAGAVLRSEQPGTVRFLGHADASTAIRHAQQRLQAHFESATPPMTYTQLALRPRGPMRNRVPKTRSLLFVVMATALATATGARRVLVPENGFTSINPPLEPSRGGVLTTRSTHPWTFHSIRGLLDTLGMAHIEIVNPYGHMTKGDLVRMALGSATSEVQGLASETVSCAKLNAGRPKGGNPNMQCGLCIACLVRRAAFIAADIPGPHRLRRQRHDYRGGTHAPHTTTRYRRVAHGNDRRDRRAPNPRLGPLASWDRLRCRPGPLRPRT